MRLMTESIPALAALDPLVDAAIRSTALIAIAAMVAVALRRASASMRHLVWTLALLGCVGMPVASRVLPGWLLPVLPATERREETGPNLDGAAGSATVVSPAPAQHEPAREPALVVAPPDRTPPSNPASALRPGTADVLRIVPIAWLAGVLLLIARHLFAWASLARIARGAQPVTDHAWQVALARHGATLGLRRLPAIRVGPGIGVPLVCGVWRPTILVPSEALGWAAERRDAVLLHELAHVRRHDLLTTRVTQLAATLYWFSPFVWLAAHSQRAEAERACDDQVLDAGGRASAYASDLLEIAHAIGGRDRLDAAALAMARRSQLEGRLLAILDPRQPRGRAGRIGISLSLLIAVGSIGVLAAVRPVQSRPGSKVDVPALHQGTTKTTAAAPSERSVAAAAPSEPTAAAAAPSEPTVAAAAPSEPTVVAATPSEPTVVAAPVKGSSHWSIVDDGFGQEQSGSWSIRDRHGSFKSKGKIRYNLELNDIESILPGGYIEIDDRRGRERHQAVFRGHSGRIDRSYSIDGDEHPWDDDARAWLAEFLIDLDHSSGTFVEQRFPTLMAEGGPARVLREISSMTSDYGRGIYLKKLLSANLDAPTLRQVVSQAGREIDSDYELAQTLIDAAAKHALDDAGTRAAYLEAIGTLQSDYEHGRVLQVLVARRELSQALADGAIASAARMESDYEQAQVMVALAEEGHVKPALQRGFVRATYDLDSDYERSRVLRALIEHGPLASENIDEMLLAAARFQSDYERANVLVTLAETVRLGTSDRAAFIEATKGFSSDYDRERALAALGRHSAR